MTSNDDVAGIGAHLLGEDRKDIFYHDRTVLGGGQVVVLPIVGQPNQHTLGLSLRHYIEDKLPSNALPHKPSHITVRSFDAQEGLPLTSDERAEKTVNRHRPYSRYNESTNNLEILCIPGTDLIKHYAALAATYWGPDTMTSYILPPSWQCYDWLQASNLRGMGCVDTVVLGYVERLSRRASSQTWDSGNRFSEPARKLFAWQICRPNETNAGSQKGSVAFLRCFFNFWGDIAASLVRVLKDFCGVRQVLYVGKAGSLRENDEPNAVIATGSVSWLGRTPIQWQSALSKVLEQDCPSEVQTGSNVSVSSPLEETQQWLSIWRERCQWVDCEVGHFASACTSLDISFGYLNIISDNVAKWHEHNLTSELLRVVREKRQNLLNIIERILDRHLGLASTYLSTKYVVVELEL